VSWVLTDKDDKDDGRFGSAKRDSKIIIVQRRSSSGARRYGSNCQEESELTSRVRVLGKTDNEGLRKDENPQAREERVRTYGMTVASTAALVCACISARSSA